MVFIGIDFGSDSCVVTALKGSRLESVTNDYNERATPSFVAFVNRKREIGTPAKNQHASNISNTIFDFKQRLVSYERKASRFEILQLDENSDGCICYKVNFMNGVYDLTPLQVTAMLFSKLKSDTNAMLGSENVTGCAIAIPAHFSASERKSILVAAGVAGLDCQYLMKETTAVALNYGFFKKFTKPNNVVFVNFGSSSIQISACVFDDARIEVLAEVADWIGGRDVDEMLAEHFIKKIGAAKDLKQNKSFCVGLLAEVEKLKKKMSVNTEELPLEIRHLLNDDSIVLNMQRSEMEEICKLLFDRIEKIMRECLEKSNLNPGDIHAVEIVGGASRMAAIKNMIEKVFGKAPVATMNQDEAVSRGCLVKHLIVRTKRNIKIIDVEQQESSTAQNGGLTIGEVHTGFQGETDESLDVNTREFESLQKLEHQMIAYDKEEVDRRDARNNLEEFVNKARKSGGTLAVISDKGALSQLNAIRNWSDGTKEEYQSALEYWTNYVPAETTNPAKIAKLDHEGAEGRGQVTSATSNVSPPAATFNGSPPATTSNISPSIIIPIVDQPRNENRGNDDRSRDRGNAAGKFDMKIFNELTRNIPQIVKSLRISQMCNDTLRKIYGFVKGRLQQCEAARIEVTILEEQTVRVNQRYGKGKELNKDVNLMKNNFNAVLKRTGNSPV